MCITPAAPHRDLLRTCFHDFPAGPPCWCLYFFSVFFFCRDFVGVCLFRWACRPSCDGCSGTCPRSCRKSVCLFRNVLEFGHGPRIEKPWAKSRGHIMQALISWLLALVGAAFASACVYSMCTSYLLRPISHALSNLYHGKRIHVSPENLLCRKHMSMTALAEKKLQVLPRLVSPRTAAPAVCARGRTRGGHGRNCKLITAVVLPDD